MDMNDREILARTLQAEAGNQGLGGMMAAGSVIMNRVGAGFGSNIRDVILAPYQFSAWNSVTGAAGGEQGQDMDFTPNADAYKAADALLSGQYEDITGGATHYYNPDISQPNWGMGAGGAWKRIGDHVFGKAGPGKRTQRGTQTMDRQQPTAQQMQQMQQQPQPQQGGLMGFLRDPRNRQVLSSFSRSGYGQRLGEIADADVARQQEQEAMAQAEQKESQQRNRTAEWLSSQPGGEMFAEAVKSGVPASKAYDAYLKSQSGDYVVVGKTLINRKDGSVVFQAPQTASMTRFNPATGQYETISGIDPSQIDLKESEAGATIYGGRMRQAENVLSLVERQGTDFYQNIVSNVPLAGNYLTTDEYKSYSQAKKNFINAVLRRESGATIADSEFANADQQYFPQPGDGDDIIAQKRANRELAIRLVEAAAGEGSAYANQELLAVQRQINPSFGQEGSDEGSDDTPAKTTSKNTIVEGV